MSDRAAIGEALRTMISALIDLAEAFEAEDPTPEPLPANVTKPLGRVPIHVVADDEEPPVDPPKLPAVCTKCGGEIYRSRNDGRYWHYGDTVRDHFVETS